MMLWAGLSDTPTHAPLSPPSGLGAGTVLTPTLRTQKHGFREVKGGTQGHTAGGGWGAGGPPQRAVCS